MRWVATTYASFKALMIALVAGQGAAAAEDANSDDRAWAAVRAAGTAEACQDYLSEFPTGAHAEEAFRCLVEGVVPGGSDSRVPAAVDIY